MPDTIDVLLIGGGGREHALALKLAQSKRLGKLYITHPENPGLAALGTPVDVPVNIREIYRLLQWLDKHPIGLVVIGPEEPLAEGYADKLIAPGRAVFGPIAEGARLEADKAWAKQLMRAASIPTAEAKSFTDIAGAQAFIDAKAADDDNLRHHFIRFAEVKDASLRRRAQNAQLRIGLALLSKQSFDAPDLTLIKDARVYRLTGSDEPILRDALSFAKSATQSRTDLPVVKAAGLAKGKGVIVPGNYVEAIAALERIFTKREFGDAGKTVVIEERLSGPEVSVLAIVDGKNILVLPPCQDHKRLQDNDAGPNTGGMGAFCPTTTIDDRMMSRIEREVLVPTLDALRREGIDYRGVLYAGLMLTPAGPKVLEFNCRFGDPECQPLMARLDTDLIDLMLAACNGKLDQIDVAWKPGAACCVVLASHGYPDAPKTGDVIDGLDDAAKVPDVQVIHAGTRRNSDGQIVTGGGRVLGVTATGATMAAARDAAYKAAGRIRFTGKQMRTDIGMGLK
ncbi:MAG: phosphoribosylamine--glycine ligase [Planctomycetota bacterium]|nr:phosphoribosylamine--glycine ligase [Planctomycetota bacterium]